MDNHRYVTPRAGFYQAQHGEDAWLERYFKGKKQGHFVDVGAYDGLVLSNSYYFEHLGWTGVLVEAHPEKAAACRTNRPRSRVFECAAVGSADVTRVELLDVPGGEVYSTVVPSDFNLQRLRDYGLGSRTLVVAARTLDSMLEESALPSVDFVSIDVEGAELEVLKGFDIARWKPRLVLIESPTPRLASIREYFVSHGYAYLRSIDINDVYEALPSAFPYRHEPAVVSALDRARYRTWKAFTALRKTTRVRTRLRDAGLWR